MPSLKLLPWFAVLALSACRPDEASNSLKEAWDQGNHPSRFASSYEFRLQQLPSEGQAEGPRWSGDYWPTDKGGIAQRWNVGGGRSEKAAYPLLRQDQIRSIDMRSLSPAEKYDIFAGDYGFGLTKLERGRTRVLASIPGTSEFTPGFEIPSWEGLCHGWAPASITYQEPKPVSLRSREGIEVSFGSADIKALLTYAMHEGMGSREEQLGTRCEVDFAKLTRQLREGQISESAYQAAIQSLPCRDTNAGSFHVILANDIGKRRQSFIADVTRDFEVWNQGVVAYRSEVGPIKQQRTAGAAPETVYEVDVATRIDYVFEIASTWNANGDQGIYKQAEYRYRLELNGNQEIVGGQWLSDERPDFLWRKSRPLVSQRLSFLPEIYQASTGQSFFAGSGSEPPRPQQPPVVQPPAPQPPVVQPPVARPPQPSPGPQPSRPGSGCAPNDPWCLG